MPEGYNARDFYNKADLCGRPNTGCGCLADGRKRCGMRPYTPTLFRAFWYSCMRDCTCELVDEGTASNYGGNLSCSTAECRERLWPSAASDSSSTESNNDGAGRAKGDAGGESRQTTSNVNAKAKVSANANAGAAVQAQRCADECSSFGHCTVSSCRCRAKMWQSAGEYFFLGTCAAMAAKVKGNLPRRDDGPSSSHEPGDGPAWSCPCNVSYVSQRCCSEPSGLVHETPPPGLGYMRMWQSGEGWSEGMDRGASN